MEIEEKYVPKVGDYVTVVKWIKCNDRSYLTDVFRVMCVDQNLIHCQFITRKDSIVLRTDQVELREVCCCFAQSIIRNKQK